MTSDATAKTEETRKRGRPARYGQGRTSLHVRFTPERIAMLKALADRNGRSLSEQVEFVVEDHGRVEELVAKLARSDAETQALLAQIYDHMEQIGSCSSRTGSSRRRTRSLRRRPAVMGSPTRRRSRAGDQREEEMKAI